jgi:hypothetical protein
VSVALVENLLLSQQQDGTYKAMLVTYELYDHERQDIRNEINVDMTDKIKVYNLEDDAFADDIFNKDLSVGDCVGRLMCPFGGSLHGAGQACVDADRGNLTLDTSLCAGPGGGGTTSNPDGHNFGGNTPWNGNQTSNGGSGTTNSSNPTLPVISTPQPWEGIMECMSDRLLNMPGAIVFLQDNKRKSGQMLQYLINGGECSDEASEFSELAVKAWLEDGEVDFVNEIIKDSTFIANDKINCTYNKISQNSTIKNLLEDFTGEVSQNALIFKVVPDLDCTSDGDIDEGCTTDNLESDNSVLIRIDQDYINSIQTPTLFLAQTIIHEVLHANLYLALYNLSNGNPTNLPDIDDFSAVYEQYRLLATI